MVHIAGIIAEYDPFHHGHAAHIAATRRDGGATHVVAVLSGSFTQRGTPAMLSKHQRAAMALAAGADLVVELPIPWSMAPAQRFAAGGVAILKALGCVELLSFGSECGEIGPLQQLAVLPDSPAYKAALQAALATGIPYAAAEQQAAATLLGETEAAHLASPNNTLGAEYIRAATAQQAAFRYFTLARQGALHTDEQPKGQFASATLLRRWITAGQTDEVRPYMPPATYELLLQAVESGTAPADPARLAYALLARLRGMTPDEMAGLPYISEGLEHRLYRAAQTAGSADELMEQIKTKRYPAARIRRLLWCALLGMQADDATGMPPYIRILGMNHRGREILAIAKPTLPLVTRVAQIADLDKAAQRVHRLECLATDLRALTLPCPQPCGTDQTAKILLAD